MRFVRLADSVGLRLCSGNKNSSYPSFAALVGGPASYLDHQTRDFSTTRCAFADDASGPAVPPAIQTSGSGHPKLPWHPEVKLLGREENVRDLKAVVKKEFAETGAARSLWCVAYAAGRGGSGKTEIGKQLPRIVASDLTLDQALLSNSAYLLIECNGGGDGFDVEDFLLKPESRLGWRLLAAVCRDSLKLRGVKGLRAVVKEQGAESVAHQLVGKGFPNVASLLRRRDADVKLEDPMRPEVVLGALARDLRRDPDSNENERVAIIVHVDEHQLMWGEGLPDNASEKAKLDAHKAFLYDLCTLRGDGSTTWCRTNNIFMFPIFTGTASAVLAPLLGVTHFSKLPLHLAPFSAEDARTLFLQKLNPTPTAESTETPKRTWTTPNTSKAVPMDFVLSELGRVPRLIIEASTNTQVREIFNKECTCGLVHEAFDIVKALSKNTGVSEQLTRLIVSGVEVRMQTIVDGRTVAQHEFDGLISRHYRSYANVSAEKFAIRVPPTEYRLSVSDHLDGTAISQFANLEYSCPGWNEDNRRFTLWSDLFEEMMMERFQNMLVVHRDILKRTAPMTVKELYPACCTSPGNMEALFELPLPEVLTLDKEQPLSLCDQTWSYSDRQWPRLLQTLKDRRGISRLLVKDHPAFDVIHLHRDGNVVYCFLEQVKNRDSPTRDLLSDETKRSQKVQNITDSIREVLKKFYPVMVQMTKTAKDQGLELQFIPVYCDRRMPTDEAVGFWSKYWLGVAGTGELKIAATVAGSHKAMAGLFPCLEHRFVLLEEPSVGPKKTLWSLPPPGASRA
jgi:hypothetical protein